MGTNQFKPQDSPVASLLTLIQTVGRSLDLQLIVGNALDGIMELFSCHGTHIRLLDQETNRLLFADYRGYDADEAAMASLRQKKIGESPTSWALQFGKVITVEDIDTDPIYGSRQGFTRQIGCRSFLSLPLHGRDALLGTLVITYRDPHSHTPEEITLFTAIGHLVGTAIDNARMYRERLDEINERTRMEQALQESEERFRLTFEHAASGIAHVSPDGRYLNVNKRFCDILGYPREEILSRSIRDVTFPEDLDTDLEFMRRTLDGEIPSYSRVKRFVRKGGELLWVNINVALIRTDTGKPDYFISVIQDITETKMAEDEIRTLSNTDSLTGLYNRRGFLVLADQQMKIAQRTNTSLALLFIDVDDLKDINDRFGHKEGDQALLFAADILKSTFRQSDILARIGGDEFAVLASVTNETPEILIEHVRKNIDTCNTESKRPYRISMSIGSAMYEPSQAVKTLDELMSLADTQMYTEKRRKRL